MTRMLSLISCLLCIQVSSAFSLSTTEQNIATYVINHKEEELALIEQLVNINSGTMNFDGVYKTGKILQEQFNQLGFKTRWVYMPKSLNRSGALYAERKGSSGKRLLLIGHLDTVFAKDSSFQRFQKKENIASGPGVVDMKGGDVVMLYALKALAASNALTNATITIALLGDEESSGKPTSISRKELIKIAHNSDIALEFEMSVGLDTATIVRRGITLWSIKATSKSAHSSKIFQPDTGYGAIFELARALDQMRVELSKMPYLAFNPGIILGGTTVNLNGSEGTATGVDNVISSQATASGDLRYLTMHQLNEVKNKMNSIVKQHLPNTDATLTFFDSMPPMSPTENNMALLKKYSQVSIDLGYGPIKPTNALQRGGSDISHVANIVPANLAGLGPYGKDEHTTQERMDIDSVPIVTQRAALLIYRLTH